MATLGGGCIGGFRRSTLIPVIWLLYAVCATAAGYQLVALAAVLRQLLRRDPGPRRFPSVSILKPVHGTDSFFEAAIESHTQIDYPHYEVLFGVNQRP